MALDDTARTRINSTILKKDKEFLDKIGIPASTALALGVQRLKQALGDVEDATTHPSLANNVIPGDPQQPRLSDAQIDMLIQQRLAASRRRVAKLPWRTPADVRAHFSKKTTTLHGLEETRDEEDQRAP